MRKVKLIFLDFLKTRRLLSTWIQFNHDHKIVRVYIKPRNDVTDTPPAFLNIVSVDTCCWINEIDWMLHTFILPTIVRLPTITINKVELSFAWRARIYHVPFQSFGKFSLINCYNFFRTSPASGQQKLPYKRDTSRLTLLRRLLTLDTSYPVLEVLPKCLHLSPISSSERNIALRKCHKPWLI